METLLTKLRYDVRRMWDRRWLAATIAAILAAIFATSIYFVRDRYQASARVYVDTQTVLKPLMAGLAFQPDIDQQVRMLASTLISRPNVARLYENPRIGLERPEPKQFDRSLELLMRQIKVAPSGKGNLYEISYRDSNADRAQHLVEALVAIFMESSIDSKKRDSSEASRFIEEQIKDYDSKLVEAENRLKEFKLKNFGVSGVASQDHFSRLSSLSDEVNKLRLELQAAEQSRDALKRELASEDPQLPPESMPQAAGAMPSELEQRLQAQRRLLDDLLRRYTDDHPDVLSARRVILQIEKQQREENEAKLAGGKGRGSAATNPVYQRLRVSLAEAEAHLASLRSQLTVQQGRLDQVRVLANRMPQVEAELAQLNRDYDVVRKNYEQLVSRREAASLGIKIDQSSQLADFRLIEPPRVSPSPVFPSRKVLAVLAMIASLALAGAAVFGLGRMHPTLDSVRILHQTSSRPILGAVSLLRSPVQRAQRRRDVYQFAAVMSVFVAIHVVWVVLIAKHVV